MSAELGPSFVRPTPLTMAQLHADSSKTTALLCVTDAGASVARALRHFAATKGMNAKLQVVSLGQGQGSAARRAIEEAAAEGNWVYSRT